jgi:hypothetical protein
VSYSPSVTEWQRAQVRAGRCRDCGRVASKGSPGYCRAHKEARAARDAAVARHRVDNGLCLGCGGARTNETTRCDECREARRDRDARYRAGRRP